MMLVCGCRKELDRTIQNLGSKAPSEQLGADIKAPSEQLGADINAPSKRDGADNEAHSEQCDSYHLV